MEKLTYAPNYTHYPLSLGAAESRFYGNRKNACFVNLS